MKMWWLWRSAKFLTFAALAVALFGVLVMLLWNALIPELFSGPSLSFWQAAGLLLLSHVLLRGWSPWRSANGWRHDRWKQRFEQKLASFSPEERERFMAGCRQRHDPRQDSADETHH
jgi:hypothetical protein